MLFIDPKKTAFLTVFFNCTEEQLKEQYRANAAGLVKMRDKAKRTGKKVNGYTLAKLEELVNKYQQLSK